MNTKRYYKKKTIPASEPLSILTKDYKESVRSQSYLGKKGYTIPKSVLSKEDDELIRKELFVKPEVFGANFGGEVNKAFPVFRENTNKLYVPRYYGISRYGLPDKSEIQEGDTIEVTFTKQLRDYQEEIIDTYMTYVTNKNNGGGAILEVFCGAGKTVCAIKIISVIKKKTLILVHKEFLMNQWIERINEFLPESRIGKIQAQTVDIENKDIVIGMIQTLYDREFPAGTFDSFGLTIIDEVHRIGSEQFSKTLLKTITPYMLGISATVDRKDKLTKILYMFIGEKIYSKKREEEDLVCVRAIQYLTNNSEFNETELDFRGNPKYSSMIVKLCEYGPRSDFIIRVIKDLIEEEPEKQIMILCHNRSLLNYLYQGIQYRKIASVGFYVGGMKQTNLQETETKNIVLATYAMAAEALDIKTLSTLVMVTPKTDITQSVGRILRAKHEKPIIVDIIDAHEMFQNQWNQRRRFYKKANYRIRQIDSVQYTTMTLDWENDSKWKRIYEPKINTTIVDNNDDDNDNDNNINQPIIGRCLIKMDEF